MIHRLLLPIYSRTQNAQSDIYNRSEGGESCDGIPEEVKEVGDKEGEGGENVEDESRARCQRKLGRS